MTNTIKLIDPRKHIAIERDGVNVGEITFDPHDALFAERFEDAFRFFGQKKTEYEQKSHDFERRKDELDEFGVPIIAHESIAYLKTVCEEFVTRIDLLFGPGTSKMMFEDSLNIELIGQFFGMLAPFFKEARSAKTGQYTYTRSGKKVK